MRRKQHSHVMIPRISRYSMKPETRFHNVTQPTASIGRDGTPAPPFSLCTLQPTRRAKRDASGDSAFLESVRTSYPRAGRGPTGRQPWRYTTGHFNVI